MYLDETDFSLSETDAQEREPFAQLVVPAGARYRFSPDRPQVIRPQQQKQLTGQDLTGTGSVTVNLDEPFAKPKNAEWQDNNFSAVAFIHDDGTDPSSSDNESISAYNYRPTNTVVVTVSAGNQTTGQTVTVYHVGGSGVLAVTKGERSRGQLTREVYLFGPVNVIAHLERDPFLKGSMLKFKPFILNELETLRIVYTSQSSTDKIVPDLVSGVQMPLYIRLEVDELLA